MTSNVLSGIKTPHITVSNSEKAQSSADKSKAQKVVAITNPNSHTMSKEFQNLMQFKTRSSTFTRPSTSHESLFNEVASLQFLQEGQHDMKKERFEVATLYCLVGKPGDILACRSLGRVMMVVAVGSYSFLGWEMQVVGEAAGPLTFQACKEASAVQWHYMTVLLQVVSASRNNRSSFC